MRVPGTLSPTAPQVEMPSPTMFAMAASIMDAHGKFASLTQSLESPEPSQANRSKQGVDIRREMEDMGLNKHDPRGVPLGPGNEYVPGNKGLLGPWNRRT